MQQFIRERAQRNELCRTQGIYGWLYGAGDAKIGQIVGKGRAEGKRLKQQFLQSMPALKKLMDFVSGKKELTGLDGRTYPIRSDHMALNTLLQGAGAVVMKQALCLFFKRAEEAYGPHGKYWALCASVHDEQQIECIPLICTGIGQMFVDSIRDAGKHLNLGCSLDGEYKLGLSWSDTH